MRCEVNGCPGDDVVDDLSGIHNESGDDIETDVLISGLRETSGVGLGLDDQVVGSGGDSVLDGDTDGGAIYGCVDSLVLVIEDRCRDIEVRRVRRGVSVTESRSEVDLIDLAVVALDGGIGFVPEHYHRGSEDGKQRHDEGCRHPCFGYIGG